MLSVWLHFYLLTKEKNVKEMYCYLINGHAEANLVRFNL